MQIKVDEAVLRLVKDFSIPCSVQTFPIAGSLSYGQLVQLRGDVVEAYHAGTLKGVVIAASEYSAAVLVSGHVKAECLHKNHERLTGADVRALRRTCHIIAD